MQEVSFHFHIPPYLFCSGINDVFIIILPFTDFSGFHRVLCYFTDNYMVCRNITKYSGSSGSR